LKTRFRSLPPAQLALLVGISAYTERHGDQVDKIAESAAKAVKRLSRIHASAIRWAYFAFIINWDAASPEDPQTVHQFFAAINLTLTLIKDTL
jgi:hypothetical protein